MWKSLWNWICKRHPRVEKKKIKFLYFKKVGKRDWNFPKESKTHLIQMAKIPIIRHILISNVNPYLTCNNEYFESRRMRLNLDFSNLKRTIFQKTRGLCLVCDRPLENSQELDLHHILPPPNSLS